MSQIRSACFSPIIRGPKICCEKKVNSKTQMKREYSVSTFSWKTYFSGIMHFGHMGIYHNIRKIKKHYSTKKQLSCELFKLKILTEIGYRTILVNTALVCVLYLKALWFCSSNILVYVAIYIDEHYDSWYNLHQSTVPRTFHTLFYIYLQNDINLLHTLVFGHNDSYSILIYNPVFLLIFPFFFPTNNSKILWIKYFH